MPRNGLATTAAVLLLGAGLLIGARVAPATGSTQLAAIAMTSMLLATAGALLGLYAALRARRTQAQVEWLTRSVDGALRRMAEGNARNASTVGALSEAINREISGALQRIAAPPLSDPDPMSVTGGNVVSLADAARRQPPVRPPEEAPVAWSPDDPIELSLQPIITVQQSAAAGFEVFARVRLSTGNEKNVRRLNGAPPRDIARFECALVKAAVEASRRQLGVKSDELPLHVPISAALLDDAAGISELTALFQLHPAAAAALVLSLPVELLSSPGGRRNTLGRLSGAGVRFAAEGWAEDGDAPMLADRGVAFLKLGCNRLLEREKSRHKLIPATELLERVAAADIVVIATDVESDEDAVSLIDLGVDLMQGEQFSGPRRLKPLQARTSERNPFEASAAPAT